MSKEMKMTDVFALPVSHESYACGDDHVEQCLDAIGVNVFDSFTDEDGHVEAASHAINNHDRLVDENQTLRDIVTRLISSGVAYQNLEEMDIDSDDIASIEAKFNDELIRADKLLTELGDGDENQQAD